jgi:hypothetical protein
MDKKVTLLWELEYGSCEPVTKYALADTNVTVPYLSRVCHCLSKRNAIVTNGMKTIFR